MEGIKLKKIFSAGFVAKLCLADLERGRLGGCPSCVVYSLDGGLYMGRPLVCVIWGSKFLLLYYRKLRLVLA